MPAKIPAQTLEQGAYKLGFKQRLVYVVQRDDKKWVAYREVGDKVPLYAVVATWTEACHEARQHLEHQYKVFGWGSDPVS